MAHKVDKEILQKVQALLNEGLSARKIGKMLGVGQSTITKWKHQYNLTYSDLRFKSTPERLKNAQKLLDEGKTFEKVSEHVGVNKTTLYEWIDSGLLTCKRRK